MMKRLFAWLIMSLMGITAVMPSFIPLAKQDETPAVVQVEKESENDTPTIVPDEPTPTPDIPTPEEETEEELGEVIPYSEAISSTTAFDNFVAQKTAELNAGIYETLKVPTTSEDYRGNELPSAYTQIEYLESTGTQYIDTGVIPTNTMKFVLESNFTSGAMGSSVASSSKTIFDFRSSAVLTYGEGKSHTYTKRNQKQKFIIDYLNSKTSCDEDENNFASTPNFGNSTFTIFTWHEYGYYYKTSGKFYSLKIYDNDALVRDFIPCYNSYEVFGLYDVVGNQFYTNQGTGIFNSAGMTTYTHSLQGSGTEVDPYQIGSFYDFEYIRKISGYNNGKHYILTNDIIFNDGKFVENEETGEIEYHAGESGELRIWSSLGGFSNCVIDGQGHKIIGFYGANLFNQFNNGAITDLHFENGYCNNQAGNANRHAFFAGTFSNTTASNCTTDGWTNGAYGTNTFVYTATNSTFTNCTNYAKNIGDPTQYYGGGIVGNANDCTIDGCENYGDIKCSGSWTLIGGIVGKANGSTTIKNCVNYATLYRTVDYLYPAGIVYEAGSEVVVEDCINEGTVACGIANGSGKIKNCKNYGAYATGIGSGTLIENCENYGECSNGIGTATLIKGCKNYKLKDSGNVYGIGYSESSTVENCINYASVGNVASFMGIGRVKSIKNCKNYGNGICNGWNNGYEAICGIGIAQQIENCVNYGTMSTVVSGRGRLSGIYVGLYGSTKNVTIVNCVNYGEIAADVASARAAGIAEKAHGNCCEQLYVNNCINYGDINVNTEVGGIVCVGGEKYTQIVNCKNYGNINTSSKAGGIGYQVNNGDIVGCENHGNLLTPSNGYKAGILYIGSSKIDQCVNYGEVETKGANGWCGGIACETVKKISNCVNYGKIVSKASGTLKGGIAGIGATEGIYNCINFGEVQTSNNQTNGIVGVGATSTKIVNCIYTAKLNNVVTKKYWGTSFNAFFYTWKDERIGLIALERNGLYRGQLTEKFLYERGFRPQDHVYFGESNKIADDIYQIDYLKIVNNSANGYRNGIDSNVRFVDGDKIEFTYKSTDTSGSIMFLCANSITTPWFAGNQSSGFTNINYTPSLTRNQLSDGTKRTITINYTSSSTGTIRFGSWQDSSWSRTIDWYSIKIYKGDNLLRDFVPVMRKSDGVLGLYDKVEGRFYTNQGTGTFIGG